VHTQNFQWSDNLPDLFHAKCQLATPMDLNLGAVPQEL